LSLAGISRVGPSTAGILMTAEPVLTVALASLVLDERLGPLQLAGGLLVVAAVIVLQLRARTLPRREYDRGVSEEPGLG
jgi:drug/metabolite transporter (DMT)-like permease